MVFQCFLIFSLTARKPPKSSEIGPKSFQHRAKIAILAAFGGLLGAILALLGAILAHLDALGRYLGSSWGSWAPSWLVLGLSVAILPPKMSQHSSNMSNDSPNSSQHRPKRPLRNPRDLIFSMNFDLQSFISTSCLEWPSFFYFPSYHIISYPFISHCCMRPTMQLRGSERGQPGADAATSSIWQLDGLHAPPCGPWRAPPIFVTLQWPLGGIGPPCPYRNRKQ